MKYICLPSFLIFVLTLLVMPQAVPAQEIYRVLTEEFPPFNYAVAGQPVGISTSIVQEAFKRAGVPFQIEVLPWKRAVRTMEDHPNVFLYTMARTPEREDKYLWVGKLFDRKVSLFRLTSRTDLDTLPLDALTQNYTACAADGDATHTLLQQVGFPERNLLTVPTSIFPGCATIVEKGRADFMAFNPYALLYRIKSGQSPDVFTEQLVLKRQDGYYLTAAPSSDPELIDALRSAFEELEAEGFNDAVAADYLKTY